MAVQLSSGILLIHPPVSLFSAFQLGLRVLTADTKDMVIMNDSNSKIQMDSED